MSVGSTATQRLFGGTAASVAALAVATALAGCQQNPSQMLASRQNAAMQAAVNRGRFELDCPTATGTVLSSSPLQSSPFSGYDQAAYSIGISGCGHRIVYVSVCQAGTGGCFAETADNPAVMPRAPGG